jgi:sec-independent protein translocase protein TatC
MQESNGSGQGQSLIEHLTELRDRIVRAAWAIGIATAACWFFNEQLFDIIRRPIMETHMLDGLVFTHPIDSFMAHVKVALVAGIVLSCPFWLFQAWQFVAPAMYEHERRASIVFIAAGTGLFAVGVSFAYFLVLPAAFKFLLSFGGGTDKPMITIKEYFSFFTSMLLVFGFAFELPLVIVVLGALGIVDQKFLREKRRIMIFVLAVVSALVTPPDAASMMMLLVPLIVLYEISIYLVGMIASRKSSNS